MPISVAVVLTCPILLLTLVVGLVVIVALCRAETKDVPTVWRDSITVLSRLADRLPKVSHDHHVIPSAGDDAGEELSDQNGSAS